MRRKFLRLLATASLAGALGACATAETVRDAPASAGVSAVFQAPYDRVAAATLDALRGLNVNITGSSEDQDGTKIQVTKSLNLFSWGEVGRVTVERKPPPGTTATPVRVYWEKRSTLQITGTTQSDFSEELFKGIQARLARP
jgi:uncharacterized lipoprotein